MNKGDTLTISLGYTINGQPIASDQFEEIEFQINSEGGSCSHKYLLSKGDIYWDQETEKYKVDIKETESFRFTDTIKYQTRFFDGVNVISSAIGTMNIGDALSRTEIGND